MARVKTGVTAHARHKKILKLATAVHVLAYSKKQTNP